MSSSSTTRAFPNPGIQETPRLTPHSITTANMFFLQALYGYDSASRTQTISFLADGGIVLAIWWLESFRQDTKAKRSWYLQ
jgi:hypothetical protein